VFNFFKRKKHNAPSRHEPPQTTHSTTSPDGGQPSSAVPPVDASVSSAFSIDDPLAAEVYLAFQTDQVQLPALPDVAARVRTMISDPDVSFDQVAQLLQADMAMTGKLITVANSPRFGGVAPVASCQAAIGRLGLKGTQDLAVSMALSRMFFARDVGVRTALKALWEHSILVAATASELAQQTNGVVDPDEAMLGGLIHDVGTLAILNHLNTDRTRRYSPDEITRVVAALRGRLGSEILRQWQFEERIVRCAEHAENRGWRSGKLEPVELVIVAQAYSMIDPADSASHASLLQLPTFKRLPICAEGVESGLQALLELRPRIEATMNVFR